ncbi:hepatoma-derived growth factor-related protein 3-like isoform X2 [Oscarella lobularis]|uniref:hepatoma-derived growth factor-related protein 3-like isoform X2 n=1 Tax=Oscarella lobularis TaxID=121494 RepID=UPI0033137C7C
MSFGVGSLIWAKMKGYPHWPARVESAMGDSKKPRKYKVFFFGTHELGYVTAKEMFPYEPNKEKFSKPLKNRGYQEALQEIEFNPNLERTEEENKEEEYHEDDDDSPDEKELTIVVKGDENEEKLERRQRVKRKFESEDETSCDTAAKKPKEEDEGWETPDETLDAGAAEGSDEDFEIRAEKKKSSLSPPPTAPPPPPPLRENAEWRQTVSKNLAALAERKRQKRENEQLIQQLSKLNLNLKMSLTVEAPDISRCLRVLSAISVLPVTKRLLRDFPDIVTTLRKVRKYKASETVMARAGPLYEKFRAIFCSDEEEEDNPEVRNEDVACETNE